MVRIIAIVGFTLCFPALAKAETYPSFVLDRATQLVDGTDLDPAVMARLLWYGDESRPVPEWTRACILRAYRSAPNPELFRFMDVGSLTNPLIRYDGRPMDLECSLDE